MCCNLAMLSGKPDRGPAISAGPRPGAPARGRKGLYGQASRKRPVGRGWSGGGIRCLRPPGSDPPGQDQNKQDHKDDPQPAAGQIPPRGTVAPIRQGTDKHQDKDYDKDVGQHRCGLSSRGTERRLGPDLKLSGFAGRVRATGGFVDMTHYVRLVPGRALTCGSPCGAWGGQGWLRQAADGLRQAVTRVCRPIFRGGSRAGRIASAGPRVPLAERRRVSPRGGCLAAWADPLAETIASENGPAAQAGAVGGNVAWRGTHHVVLQDHRVGCARRYRRGGCPSCLFADFRGHSGRPSARDAAVASDAYSA